MADNEARPEFNPKHRIVGAIVLVALAVLLFPMILSDREPPTEPAQPVAKPAAAGATDTQVVVTPVPAPEIKPRASGDIVPAAAPETSKPRVETKATAVKKQEPTQEKTAKPATASEKSGDGWVVQVGTFSNTQNAIRLRDKLKGMGHSVHTETVTLSGKKALRLRVGPFADRAKADKVQSQIRKETGVAGVVQSSS